MDNFEDGIHKWYASLSGDGAAIIWDGNVSRLGGFSAKATAGDNVGRWAILQRVIYKPVTSRLGLETSFCWDGTPTRMSLTGRLYDGTNHSYYGMSHDPANNTLDYIDSAGDWQSFATGIDLSGGIVDWHIMKLVFDPSTFNYVRAIVDGTE